MDWLHQRYVVGKRLGQGHYGIVFAVEHKHPKAFFRLGHPDQVEACKKIRKASYRSFEMEARIMKQLRGVKGVVQLRRFHQDEQGTYLIMELCEFDLLKALQIGFLSTGEAEAARITRLLAKSVKEIHARGIVHRDLKLTNVLVTRRRGVRVGDFGSATFCRSDEVLNEFVGTSRYMAPEVRTGKYGRQVDVYGLGLIVYALVERVNPFGNVGKDVLHDEAARGVDVNRKYLRFELASHGARKLILRMTEVDPERRMTIDQVLKDKWLRQWEGVF